MKANETMDEKSVPFIIKNADALVCVSGAVMTIRDALQQQRKTKPDANVCYHSVKAPEDNPNSFVLSATHCVAYIPSGGTSKQKKENANPGDEDNGSEGGAVTANNVALGGLPSIEAGLLGQVDCQGLDPCEAHAAHRPW